MKLWKLLLIASVLVLVFVLVWPGGLLTGWGWGWSHGTTTNNKSLATEPAPIIAKATEPAPVATDPAPDEPPVSGQEVTTEEFALKGLRFPAYADGVPAPDYDLFVEANGRFWQAWLPIGPNRVAHSVSFELPAGNYVFNGVVCRLYVDSNHNGGGTSNVAAAANGNDLRFTVELPANADFNTAWALVECDGGSPSGFDVWYLGQ